jgi:proteasome accessory factor B
VSWRGRWYLPGHDRDRNATRVFRLSRIRGEVRPAGEPGEVVVPEGVDVRGVVVDVGGPVPTLTARVRVRAGSAGFLRRRSSTVREDGGGWDVLEVAYSDPGLFADSVVGLGSDAVVLEPADLREAVVRRLRAVLEAAS